MTAPDRVSCVHFRATTDTPLPLADKEESPVREVQLSDKREISRILSPSRGAL